MWGVEPEAGWVSPSLQTTHCSRSGNCERIHCLQVLFIKMLTYMSNTARSTLGKKPISSFQVPHRVETVLSSLQVNRRRYWQSKWLAQVPLRRTERSRILTRTVWLPIQDALPVCPSFLLPEEMRTALPKVTKLVCGWPRATAMLAYC